MSESTRREFFKAAGALAVGSAVPAAAVAVQPSAREYSKEEVETLLAKIAAREDAQAAPDQLPYYRAEANVIAALCALTEACDQFLELPCEGYHPSGPHTDEDEPGIWDTMGDAVSAAHWMADNVRSIFASYSLGPTSHLVRQAGWTIWGERIKPANQC